jgi:hypothetical protein
MTAGRAVAKKPIKPQSDVIEELEPRGLVVPGDIIGLVELAASKKMKKEIVATRRSQGKAA